MIDKAALDRLTKSECAPHFKRIGLHPHHGFVLMLSAIHSKESCGIGEFLDMLPLLNWASEIGLDFIQLLPLADTGSDNSPYNPISTLALNPVFLSLSALPYLNEDKELQDLLKKMQKGTQKNFVNYLNVRDKKSFFMKLYNERYGSRTRETSKYKHFLKQNSWVFDYGLFNTFSEHYQTQNWSDWPKSKHSLNDTQKSKFIKKYHYEMQLYLLTQYFCFEQLKQVKKVAEEKTVFLFGDLPFLVSRQSCDAWSYPKLFLTDYSVGSPPDRLTPEGQNWDFPAYNWKELKSSEYHWWKLRLKVAENFFQIYRLDHIIGFTGLGIFPLAKKVLKELLAPRIQVNGLKMAETFKSPLKYSKMLPIGEDLVIPQAIIDSMQALGISGTRILTWQRTGAGGLDFVPYPLYTVASITCLTSHDTTTLAQWWKKYSKTAKEFALWKNWKYTPSISHAMRLSLLKDSHQTSSLFHANLLQEYLALYPELVHKKINEERINYPGTPSHRNWKYRFVPSVEKLVKNRKMTHAFKTIIT